MRILLNSRRHLISKNMSPVANINLTSHLNSLRCNKVNELNNINPVLTRWLDHYEVKVHLISDGRLQPSNLALPSGQIMWGHERKDDRRRRLIHNNHRCEKYKKKNTWSHLSGLSGSSELHTWKTERDRQIM